MHCTQKQSPERHSHQKTTKIRKKTLARKGRYWRSLIHKTIDLIDLKGKELRIARQTMDIDTKNSNS